MKRSLWLWMWLGLIPISCQKTKDYLTYLPVQAPPPTFTTNYRIKDLQGHNSVDILWSIDNSGSMGTYQSYVVQNTEAFMKALLAGGALNWKMGLVSTYLPDSPFIGFDPGQELDSRTKDPVTVFRGAVSRLGTNKGCPELVFQPLTKMLKSYKSFLRSHSLLVVISMTDTSEEKQSDAQDFLDEVARQKGSLADVVWYGIYAVPDLGCSTSEPQWEYATSPFAYTIKQTRGKVYPLCSPKFAQNLTNLGKEIKQQLKVSRLPLTVRPVPKTIQITFKGKDLPGGPQDKGGIWYYETESNAIVFYDLEFAPADTEEVSVTFVKAT